MNAAALLVVQPDIYVGYTFPGLAASSYPRRHSFISKFLPITEDVPCTIQHLLLSAEYSLSVVECLQL